MEKRTRFQKVMLIVLAAMLVVSGVLLAILQSQKGAEFKDVLLRTSVADNVTTYTGKSHGEPVNITVCRKGNGQTEVNFQIGEVLSDLCVVDTALPAVHSVMGDVPGVCVTKNGRVLFQGGWKAGQDGGLLACGLLFDANGELTVPTSEFPRDDWDLWQIGVDEILTFAGGPELKAWGDGTAFAMATLLTLLAMALTAFPRRMFRRKYRWFVKDPEPTEFYLQLTMVGSLLLAVVALAFYILALRTIP